jgi:hypothetical protein
MNRTTYLSAGMDRRRHRRKAGLLWLLLLYSVPVSALVSPGVQHFRFWAAAFEALRYSGLFQ